MGGPKLLGEGVAESGKGWGKKGGARGCSKGGVVRGARGGIYI